MSIKKKKEKKRIKSSMTPKKQDLRGHTTKGRWVLASSHAQVCHVDEAYDLRRDKRFAGIRQKKKTKETKIQVCLLWVYTLEGIWHGVQPWISPKTALQRLATCPVSRRVTAEPEATNSRESFLKHPKTPFFRQYPTTTPDGENCER